MQIIEFSISLLHYVFPIVIGLIFFFHDFPKKLQNQIIRKQTWRKV